MRVEKIVRGDVEDRSDLHRHQAGQRKNGPDKDPLGLLLAGQDGQDHHHPPNREGGEKPPPRT